MLYKKYLEVYLNVFSSIFSYYFKLSICFSGDYMADEVIFLVEGNGPTILFLPGWNNSMQVWRPIVNILKCQYRCVLIELPGFGKASAPIKPFDVSDYTDYVQKFLNEHDFNPNAIVGHSFGGKIATELIDNYPNCLLVYVASSVIKPKDSLKKKIIRRLVRYRKKHNLSIEKYGSKDYLASEGTMRSTFVKAVNTFYDHKMTKIVNRVLIYWGKQDCETPVWMAKKIKSLVYDSKIVIVNGGHFAHLDNPYVFAACLDSFIKEDS